MEERYHSVGRGRSATAVLLQKPPEMLQIYKFEGEAAHRDDLRALGFFGGISEVREKIGWQQLDLPVKMFETSLILQCYFWAWRATGWISAPCRLLLSWGASCAALTAMFTFKVWCRQRPIPSLGSYTLNPTSRLATTQPKYQVQEGSRVVWWWAVGLFASLCVGLLPRNFPGQARSPGCPKEL